MLLCGACGGALRSTFEGDPIHTHKLTCAGCGKIHTIRLGAVRDYEQGCKGPSVPSLFKLAAALGVSCEAFKDCIGADQPEPPAKKGRKRKGV